MLYSFAYSAAALAYLRTIPVKHREQIVRKVRTLEGNPRPRHCKVIRGTKSEETVHRVRSGDYRVLYVVRDEPEQIVILDIDHRKDVYR